MPKASRARSHSQTFSSFLSRSGLLKRKYRSVILFTHRQADPDALCSAYATSQLLLKKDEKQRRHSNYEIPSCRIIAPQGASLLGSNVCKAFSIRFEEKISSIEIEKANLIIAVDVGDKELLEPYLLEITNSKAKKILIDHHSSMLGANEISAQAIDPFDYRFVDDKATSTCEIITLGFPQKLLDEKLSRILLAGLLYDSQHLAIATDRTLEASLKLVRKGATINDTKDLLRLKPDRSEIIARLKSSQRLQYMEIGKYLIAKTQVSSFQASVARMLIDIGADVGIAFGEHQDETRISVRATQRFFRETGVDLGVVLSKISRLKSMTGGGHSTAASISGNAPTAELVERIVSDIAEKLP